MTTRLKQLKQPYRLNNYDDSITIYHPEQEFQTKNRALEQYLYAHSMKPAGWFKDANNFTVWHYPATEELMELVHRYAYIQVYGTGWREQRDGYARRK